MILVFKVSEWMSQHQHQLELRDVQIPKLEGQVRELGEYNKDLSVQLKKESIEGLKEDESLYLKSVEQTIDNVKVDQLGSPGR